MRYVTMKRDADVTDPTRCVWSINPETREVLIRHVGGPWKNSISTMDDLLTKRGSPRHWLQEITDPESYLSP